jgi:hypothetical protein
MRFWRNPEFVRHLRAELRMTRALTLLAVVIAICLLIWLACWGSRQAEVEALRNRSAHVGDPRPELLERLERESPMVVWRSFYSTLLYAQLAVLTFWSLLSCAQSISRERERKTWDFQRATRLSPRELLVGKVLGEPVVAYFIVACCLPITVVASLLGHMGLRNVLAGYTLIVAGALFIGLTGLWLSSLFESRSRGAGLIGTLVLYGGFALITQMVGSSFPGAAAFSPLTGLLVLLGDGPPATVSTIFGQRLPWLVMSLLLYGTFGAWLVVMILRTLKKDYDQAKALSRWQAVGCAAFLNFTAYALFFPRPWGALHAQGFASFMVVLNGFFLFGMGLAMITPYERLKVWWRTRRSLASLLAEDGPPWPWLVLSAAVGYGLLVWGMYAWRNDVGFEPEVLVTSLVQFLVLAVYITRDIMFIQWCRLTHMRAPVLKGFLYAALYYSAAATLSGVLGVSSASRGRIVYSLLTPAGAFDLETSGSHFSMAVFVGIGMQVLVIALLVAAIAARLNRRSGKLAIAGAD